VRNDLSAALRVRPADAAWAFALRAGAAIAVPLVVLVGARHPAWAPFATFGAFAALYGRDEPYRRRAVLVAASALGLVASVAAGGLAALASSPAIFGVVAVALVGAAATLLCTRYRTGPPAGLMFAFATAVCSALPTSAGDLPRNVGLAAGSAVVAWLIVMSGALVTPDAPRRLVVARALRATAALHAAPGGPGGLRARHQAALAVEKAWRVAAGDPLLEVLVAHAETELSGVHGHSAAAAAELLDLAGRLPRRTPTALESAKIGERHRALVLLRDRPSVRAPIGPAAARVALGALVAGAAAGLLTHVTGLGHPYWAAVSAVAVLQAASLRMSRQRALQRAAGTIAGLLIAGGAVALPGGPWLLVGEIVVAQVIAELLVIRNYALAMLAVTPLALLVGELGHKSPPLDLIGDRLVQTVLGCLLGLAAAAVVSNRAANRRLAEAAAAVEQATEVLRHQPASASPREPGDLTGPARRLALLVATMREAYEVAAGEPGLDEVAVGRVLRAEGEARSALASLSVPTPSS
jgi:uncharacterized membrane protein YccC